MSFSSIENKTPSKLREQLRKSIKEMDKAGLEKAIAECEAAGFPELAFDLRNARQTLQSLGGGQGG